MPFEIAGVDPDPPRLLDSTAAQFVHPLPKSLMIVGAGPIGLEFATMFAGFGSQVTVLNRSARLLSDQDEELTSEIEANLREQGVTILHEVSIVRGTDTGSESTLELDNGTPLAADALLAATGRVPATEGLGLEAVGVEVDERGAIVVDDLLRTSAENVWAVGDVNGGPQFT